jgi:PhoPQ-activated pathogenicity-related protein
MFLHRALLPLALILLLTSTASAQLTVVSHSPSMNAGNQAPLTDVVVDFDRAVDASSLPPVGRPTFQVFGAQGGTNGVTLVWP